MSLEDLRNKAYFQNTIDVWIAYCEENNWTWSNKRHYMEFIHHLESKGVKMQKFPLCIKESGGVFERGRDKAKFLEELSQSDGDYVSAYTLKLSNESLSIIRQYKPKIVN